MITYTRLPAGNQLEGISDWFGMPSWVRSYWNVVKGKIADLQALGPKISAYQQKIAIAQSRLQARGLTNAADSLNDELAKINDDLQKWWKVKGYIDTYLPQWLGLEENIKAGVSGLGFVPIVLAGMALVALAYVVNTGMALLQDYMFKSQLTQDVIEQKLTSGQAADILSVPSSEGVIEKVVGKVGSGVGFGLPIALVAGVGGYLLYTTVLRDMLFGVRS
jgi:hypothetical protein